MKFKILNPITFFLIAVSFFNFSGIDIFSQIGLQLEKTKIASNELREIHISPIRDKETGRINQICYELGNKDSNKIRYYEAPYDELPFGYFKIIDTSAIIVYSQIAYHKRYGGYLKYYYSLNSKSRIHELSVENLEVDFTDNKKFLRLAKNNENSLAKIVNGITVINKLLNESLK